MMHSQKNIKCYTALFTHNYLIKSTNIREMRVALLCINL